MKYQKRFFDKYVSKNVRYSCNHNENISIIMPYLRQYFTRFLPDDRQASILDVGCGSGEFLIFLQNMGYTNISGIDLSEEQIEIARKRGLKNVQVAEAIDYLTYHKVKYALITAHDVIEHFPKDKILEFMDALYNSLITDGYVILSTINAECLFGARYRYGDFTHEVSFTHGSISHILRVTGFEVIGIFPKEPIIHGIKSFIRWFIWGIIKQVIKFYILVETGSAHGIYTQAMYAVGKKNEQKDK